jgi:preprotein translocase subunit SecG
MTMTVAYKRWALLCQLTFTVHEDLCHSTVSRWFWYLILHAANGSYIILLCINHFMVDNMWTHKSKKKLKDKTAWKIYCSVEYVINCKNNGALLLSFVLLYFLLMVVILTQDKENLHISPSFSQNVM